MNPKVFLALAICAIMAREAKGGVAACPAICGIIARLTGLPMATALGALIGPAAVGPFLAWDGMSFTACMAVCTGGTIAIPACFDQNAEVHVYGDTTKNIRLLRVGDSVGEDDTVLAVTVMQGEFDFVEIATDDGNKINITSPHLMVTYLSNGTKMLQPAMKVVKGDVMQNSSGDRVNVVHTRKFIGNEKIEVETTSGLLTVNGLQTTTFCDNYEPLAMIKFGPKGIEFDKAIGLMRDDPISKEAAIRNKELWSKSSRPMQGL